MNILLGKYETFKMKYDETVTEINTRYTKILNGLANQGKTFTEGENADKILRALSKKWNHVNTSIQKH